MQIKFTRFGLSCLFVTLAALTALSLRASRFDAATKVPVPFRARMQSGEPQFQIERSPGLAPSARPLSDSGTGNKGGRQKPPAIQSSSSSNADRLNTDTSQSIASEPTTAAMPSALPAAAQAGPPNPLNLPDPATATATELATKLNSLTPQAVPQETILLGEYKLSPNPAYGAYLMSWILPTRQTSPTCPGRGGPLVVTSVQAPVAQINSYNEQYQILIDMPATLDVKISLTVYTLDGSEIYPATLVTNPPGSGMFAGATVATIAFHPRTSLPQTLSISYSGGWDCYTIIPNLQPQLGAFVVPYLPITVVYQPPGCGQCVNHTPSGDVPIPCGSYASYMNTTKIGTTLSWGTSSTSGTIQTVDSNDFFKKLSQAAGAASTIAGAIPGGQAAAGAFGTMGKVSDFLGSLSNTEQITTITQTQGHTETRGWTISSGEGAQTDICQSDDLFVYLKDVVFIYAVVPEDPVSGNVTPSGVPTVILTPYYYKERRQVPFSQLQSQLPATVAEQFRGLDLRMNPWLLQRALGGRPGPIGFGRSNPRLIPRHHEECPALPGAGTNDITVQQENFTTSETSQAATSTTITNNTGLLASIFQIDPGTHTISGGQPGETTQSVTYSSAVSNWQSDSADAGLHLKCPEYYPPAPGLEVAIYLDNLFGTLLALPVQVESNEAPIVGTISNERGQPVSGMAVLLKSGDRTYRVFSDANGKFAFRFASIPKGPGVLVVGKDNLSINYNGMPLANLNFRIGSGVVRSP